MTSDPQHQATIEQLQSQVRSFYARKVPFRVYHGSTNSTRVLSFKRTEMVDISGLKRILAVDTVRKTAVVEPNVPMDQLVKATLRHGLVPPVVPEFPGITVGGAIQGTAAETSSHLYGCFSQNVSSMEYILGDGTRITVSPEEHSDMFYGSAGSCGSLGLITAAEVQLVTAPKYVIVTHYQVSSFEEGVRLMRQHAAEKADFIEWVMFDKDHGAVVIGSKSDAATCRIKRFSRPHDPWYYHYVKATAEAGVQVTDSIPVKDYLFRFNRGAFWAADLAFKQSGIPLNGLTRFVLDPFLRTRKLYQALQASAASQQYICQDLVLPEATVLPFLEFIDREFNMYPIGGCPILPEVCSPLQCNGIKAELLFNIGVYGLRVDPYDAFVRANRRIEAKTAALGGKKWLYAHNYYSEAEFWKIYDKQWYGRLRQKYHATTLPDIYERTRVKEQFTVDKRRGIVRTMLGLPGLRIT